MRTSRSRLLAAAVVALLVFAPLTARAYNGTFNPQFTGTVANTLAGQTSDLTVQMQQQDQEDPIVAALLRLPGGWGFDSTLPNIKPAQRSDGSPAGGCNEAVENQSNGKAGDAYFARAEVLGPAYLTAQASFTRPGNPIVWNGSIGFLNYDATNKSAHMCLLLDTTDQRIPSIPNVDLESVTDIVTDFELSLGSTDQVPHMAGDIPCATYTPKADGLTWWQTCADFRDLVANATFQQLQVSLITFRVGYNAVSNGNWNPTRAAVSKTATTPGDYMLLGAFETCPQSGKDARYDYGSCKSTHGAPTPPVVRTVPFHLTLPATGAHPIPQLLSPLPFGVLGASPTIRWKENFHDEPPAGYVLTIATPGQRDESEIFRARYMTTPGGKPCDGSGVCNLSLQFPLITPAGKPLGLEAKYSLALVAIFQDGHRSDGRCDDGTPAGTVLACSARVTTPPGAATAEFFVSAHAWPLHYVDSSTFDKRPDGAPTYDSLLIDPASGAFDYVEWDTGGPAIVYAGRDPNAMRTTNGVGVLSFVGSGKGVTDSWSLRGVFSPQGSQMILVRPEINWRTPDAPSIPTLDGTYQPPAPQLPVPREIALPVAVEQPHAFNGTPAPADG